MANAELRKMKLNSDFHDYYDHMFDLEGRVYDRIAKDDTHRQILISQLEHMGYWTPIAGPLSYVGHQILAKHKQSADEARVVVHTDPTAHGGVGKELMTLTKAYDMYVDNACAVEYIEPGEPNVSYRHLVIGRRCFRLKYTSFHDWRSNVGDGKIEVVRECSGLIRRNVLPPVPVIAIDFIEDKSGWHWAIDLNIAPGMRGTGIEKIMSPTEVVREIKKFYDWSDFLYRNHIGDKDARA